eukprot:12817657-Alexandrium_andersonii.AAC.1
MSTGCKDCSLQHVKRSYRSCVRVPFAATVFGVGICDYSLAVLWAMVLELQGAQLLLLLLLLPLPLSM